MMSESATTSCTGILSARILASGQDFVSSMVFTFSTSWSKVSLGATFL
jgi:hypothetical protein